MKSEYSYLDIYLAHWILLTSTVVTVVYIINSIFKKKLVRDSLVNVLATFISVASVFSGLNLVYHTFAKNSLLSDPLNLEDSELLYTIFGGFVVAWIALWELIKQFKEVNA